MFNTKAERGNNLCGVNVARIRCAQRPFMSQGRLAEKLQLLGFQADRHAVRRMESGERFITDIELKMLCDALNVSPTRLLDV
jgi:hypothetical protein